MSLVAVGHELAVFHEVVAPGIERAGESAARGEFPFGFGRQSLAGPLRIRHGVVVGDVHDGKFFLPFDGAVGSGGMPPIGTVDERPPLEVIVERHGVIGGENTTEPAMRFSGGAVGKSSAVGFRSATVTYPVALTKRANCSLVTSVASIQKPSTATRCIGRESVVACMPTRSLMSMGERAPIENSPPGIHTMPSGAEADEGPCSRCVGRNASSRRCTHGWAHLPAASSTA